jgi:hypothetical protein
MLCLKHVVLSTILITLPLCTLKEYVQETYSELELYLFLALQICPFDLSMLKLHIRKMVRIQSDLSI